MGTFSRSDFQFDEDPRMDCPGRPPVGWVGLAALCQERQSSLGHLGLRGEGSTPVPLPPPTLSVLRFSIAKTAANPSIKLGLSKS